MSGSHKPLKSGFNTGTGDWTGPRDLGISADFEFLVHAWNTYHLKKLSEVPPEVIVRLHAILDPIDNEHMMALILGTPQSSRWARSRTIRQTRSATHLGVVPVVPHYRRLP